MRLICWHQASGCSVLGKDYIANPDLYERLLQDAPLNELKLENMIGTDVAAGYVDYPTLAEMETAAV
jgi:2,4-dienoyl-CoA reductase-like NADH-dependent reductase (Old Yellow Enzyme family)